MARRFRGGDTHKVDSKGRVSVPANFRRVLEANDPEWTDGLQPNLVIHYGNEDQKHLEVYTMDAVDEIDARFDALDFGSEEREQFAEDFYGCSIETQTDDSGRLMLPKAIRDKVGITGEAMFMGAGKTFHIWDPATYESLRAARRSEGEGRGNPLRLLQRARPEE